MKLKTRVLTALWFFQVVNYLDRTVISFAAPAIMKSLSLGPKQFGIVLSSFALGYFLGQVPGGLIADRWGARNILVIAPLFWALFTGATGLAATLAGFVVVRLCFGLSEGLSNAPCWKALGDVFAPQERARAGSIWLTALPLAPALAGPLMSLSFVRFGWRHMFMLLALPALLTALVNWLSLPARNSAPERPASTTSANTIETRAPRPSRNFSLWVLAVGYFSYNITYFGYLAWMPTYLASSRGINLKAIGYLGSIPYATACVGLIVIGWLANSVLKHYLPQLAIVCYLGAALGLYIAYSGTTLHGSIAGLCLAAAFLYGALSPFSAMVLNLAPDHAKGSYASVVTASGQLGGVAAPAVIGYMVSASGAFLGGFVLMIIAIVVAAACTALLVPKFAAIRIEAPTPSASVP